MPRRLIVTGRVQGVFYRDWFVREARALGLAGWVRNRRDGSVEAVIDGAPAQVEAMSAAAWHGSPAAAVENVAVDAVEDAELAAGFERRPTA